MICLVLGIVARAQVPVGGWRDHLSWNTADAVAVAGDKVYCSNGVGLCIYNVFTRHLEKLTKHNGLSDAGVTALEYAPDAQTVVVGYASGNIDLITDKGIVNIPDVKRNSLYADRRINHICVAGKMAYLSCPFGVVAVNLQSQRIADTYIIGDGGAPAMVNAVAISGGMIYAATTDGIKKADKNSNRLTDFSVWERIKSGQGFKQLAASDNTLYACDMNHQISKYEGSVFSDIPLSFAASVNSLKFCDGVLIIATDKALLTYSPIVNAFEQTITTLNNRIINAHDAWRTGGVYWIADHRQGLCRWSSANEFYFCVLNGPSSNHASAFRYKADKLLAVSGGRSDAGTPLHLAGELHIFAANQWSSIAPEGLYDFTDADMTSDNTDTYYVASWGGGVYVFQNGVLAERYNAQNSPLIAGSDGVLCGGLLMDANNKLWVSNGRQAALLAGGQWTSSAWSADAVMGRFVEDENRQIWTTRLNKGLWVFDKTSTEAGQTNKAIGFTPYNYTGSIPAYNTHQIANTPDGIIWVTTNLGPVYYNNTARVMDEPPVGFHPNRAGSDEPSLMYALLGSENTLSVAVDGAYRKWFGTENGGVFLIDEDNTGEVRHFTTANSPLFSDKIRDIAINDRTGEVFFATDYGIQSYRSDAVSSGDDFGKVYVFPNPVHPDYQGEITITGLIKDADVKITDVAGNLVHHTRTLGGQAVWNGCNSKGRRVATGVYLVFCTNDDGSKTHITKLLFIR
ncbi:MAG: hypothetical protein LBU62_12155 [Bacteroidales bacterium]|nr:hypothetical protein [Bacteroidales bacterium]